MTYLKDKILKECNKIEKIVTKTNQTIELINNRENDIYCESLVSALTLYIENFYK